MLVTAHVDLGDDGMRWRGFNAVTCSAHVPSQERERFRHEAVFYRGLSDIVDVVLPFVREGIELGEPVMVATLPDRIAALEDALGPDAARVRLVDMAGIGSNPARIIPAWRSFVAAAPSGTRVRGVGEPVWWGRRNVELEECRLHEALLNVAFDDGPAWRLMCPYDIDALGPEVVDDVVRTHPVVVTADARGVSYEGHDHALSAFGAPLAEPPAVAHELEFTMGDLPGLRGLLRRLATTSGLGGDAGEDVVLAAHELATNSIVHGGGRGTLRAWTESDAFVIEVRDTGRIDDPLVGRDLTFAMAENGRGVWMANQLCDLVQVRSTAAGTVVRLYSWL
jgi:anti-sigma regulatory factor (Ser/Thr protein kinase)